MVFQMLLLFLEFSVASSFSTLCLTIQNYFHNMEGKEFMKNSFTKSITDFTLLSLYGMHYPLHASASALGKIPYLVTDVKFVLLFLTMLKLVKTDRIFEFMVYCVFLNIVNWSMDFFMYGRNCYIWPAHMKQTF